jgi:4-diphosphocytidyl-2-C-methyl-D-erythritol kinase
MLEKKSYTRITLALDILRRIDEGPLEGFHEIQALKHRISLHDIIAVEPSPRMSIECDNPLVPCDSSNICWKAAQLLKTRHDINSDVHIRIGKNIPVQGGLAGGSANAATTMILCCRLWNLKLSIAELCALGREVGMDVPYYFVAPTCLDTEATGKIEPVDTGIHLDFVLLLPDFGVATKQAYGLLDYRNIGKNRDKTAALVEAVRNEDKPAIAATLHNDFEEPVF